MAKCKNKLKLKKKKAQAYQRLIDEVFRAACDLNMTEEQVCFEIIIQQAHCYVASYERLQEEKKADSRQFYHTTYCA